MSWQQVSSDDVRLTPAEKATLDGIAGSSSVVAEKLGDVIGEFRDSISATGVIVSTETGTVPDLVRIHVINRTCWLWLCEFPQLKSMQTKERAELNTAAEKMLANISSGAVKVPSGDGTPSAANIGAWGSDPKLKLRDDSTK